MVCKMCVIAVRLDDPSKGQWPDFGVGGLWLCLTLTDTCCQNGGFWKTPTDASNTNFVDHMGQMFIWPRCSHGPDIHMAQMFTWPRCTHGPDVHTSYWIFSLPFITDSELEPIDRWVVGQIVDIFRVLLL